MDSFMIMLQDEIEEAALRIELALKTLYKCFDDFSREIKTCCISEEAVHRLLNYEDYLNFTTFQIQNEQKKLEELGIILNKIRQVCEGGKS